MYAPAATIVRSVHKKRIPFLKRIGAYVRILMYVILAIIFVVVILLLVHFITTAL